MKQAIVLESDDIKMIIAKHFGVAESLVVKAKYSYIVLEQEGDNDGESN